MLGKLTRVAVVGGTVVLSAGASSTWNGSSTPQPTPTQPTTGANPTESVSSTTVAAQVAEANSTGNGSSILETTSTTQVTWPTQASGCYLVLGCYDGADDKKDCKQLLEEHSRKCQYADGADPETQIECAMSKDYLMRYTDCVREPSPTTSSKPDNAQVVSSAHRLGVALSVAIVPFVAAQQ
jgi:hypothetical protein